MISLSIEVFLGIILFDPVFNLIDNLFKNLDLIGESFVQIFLNFSYILERSFEILKFEYFFF